jgi:hypothetical protein
MATMDQSQSRILIEGIGETKAVKAGHSVAMAWRLSNRYYPFLAFPPESSNFGFCIIDSSNSMFL